MKRLISWLAVASCCAGTLNGAGDLSWRTSLEQQLPRLGHRNWIVIADAAYPWQTARGIQTVVTDANQIEVVKVVLDAVAKSQHVRPIIYTDAELPLVPEQGAKGITEYRVQLARALGKREVQSLPHEQIIAKLDEAGNTFHVLVLKTKLTLPYTSVFLQLDCAYWRPEAEQQLRAKIKVAAPPK